MSAKCKNCGQPVISVADSPSPTAKQFLLLLGHDFARDAIHTESGKFSCDGKGIAGSREVAEWVEWPIEGALEATPRIIVDDPSVGHPGDALRKLSQANAENSGMSMGAHLALLEAANVLDQLGVIVSVEPQP